MRDVLEKVMDDLMWLYHGPRSMDPDKLVKSLRDAADGIETFKKNGLVLDATQRYVAALEKGDLKQMAELTDRGLKPSTDFLRAHIGVFAEALKAENPAVLDAVIQGGWGVPAEPLAKIMFLKGLVSSLSSSPLASQRMPSILMGHTEPNESVVVEFAAKVLNSNGALSPLRDLIEKGHLDPDRVAVRSSHLPDDSSSTNHQRIVHWLKEGKAMGLQFESTGTQSEATGRIFGWLRDRQHAQAIFEGMLAVQDMGSKNTPSHLANGDANPAARVQVPFDRLDRMLWFSDDQLKQLHVPQWMNSIAQGAVRSNSYDELSRLASLGVDLTVGVGNGKTLAHLLAKAPAFRKEPDGVGSDVKTLQVLHAAGVDLSAKDDQGMTAANLVIKRKDFSAALTAFTGMDLVAEVIQDEKKAPRKRANVR